MDEQFSNIEMYCHSMNVLEGMTLPQCMGLFAVSFGQTWPSNLERVLCQLAPLVMVAGTIGQDNGSIHQNTTPNF